MRKKLSVKCNGIVTVYLTLVMLLIMSFILGILEAARITACRAELYCVTGMASDSLKGMYYYPLFEQYGLLAVDSGFKSKTGSTKKIEQKICTPVKYTFENTSGGLLTAESSSVKVNQCVYLKDNNESGFLAQVRREAVHEGIQAVYDKLMKQEGIGDVQILSDIYDRQSKAMEQAAAVTEELLKLMTIVDGVKTTAFGICSDENGEIAVSDSFVKQLGIKDAAYMQGVYKCPEVFQKTVFKMVYFDKLAENTKESILEYEGERERYMLLDGEADVLSEGIEECDILIQKAKEAEDKDKLKELKDRKQMLEARRKEVVKELSGAGTLMKEYDLKARENYAAMQNLINEFKDNTQKALNQVALLKIKEAAARAVADDYVSFLKDIGDDYGNVVAAFIEDSVHLTDYTDLKRSGYNTDKMADALGGNLLVASVMELPAYDACEADMKVRCISLIEKLSESISYDNLCFNYSGLLVKAESGRDTRQALKELVSTGILSALSVEGVSDKRINGLDLPSESSPFLPKDLFKLVSEYREQMRDIDIKTLMMDGMNMLSDDLMLEIYLMNHFRSFGDNPDNTKIQYEREYILYGNETDKENLTAFAMNLIALRSVFTFASLMADGTRQMQAESLAASVAGFTGFLPLLYIVKYAILTVWAIEEAIVEVSALLKGKRVPIYSPSGNINMYEIAAFSKPVIQKKVALLSDNPGGLTCKEYLVFFSVLEPNRKKCLRAMDLIQENIRLRYNDGFRINNALTGVDFDIEIKVKRIFGSELIGDDRYKLTESVKAGF